MKSLLATRIYVFVDIICLVLFALGILLFAVVGKPYNRGFFCNDESIKKPYKDSTVSSGLAVGVAAALTLVVVCLTELALNKGKCSTNQDGDDSNQCSKIPSVLKTIIWVIFVDLYGAALNSFITDVGKYTLGRLRPHFFDVCKPAWNTFNCTDVQGRNIFVTQDVCTGTNAKLTKEMRLSFPSGHASFSAYTMVFLALYIEAKVHLPRQSKFLKILAQAFLILLALYTGFTRVSDYKHHWSDVLAGFFLGTTLAFIIIFKVLKPRFTRNCGKGPGNSRVFDTSEQDSKVMMHEQDIEAGPR